MLVDFAMRTRADRRWNREVKAWRRIKEDRQQHSADKTCPCFGAEDPAVWGRTFARFADTPKACGCPACGNPRRNSKGWPDESRLTIAERRDMDRVRDDLRHLEWPSHGHD